MNLFQQILQKLVKQFTRTMNRGPNTSFEWMELQNEAVRMLNKTKGVPQTPPKSPFPGWNPRVVEGGKKPAEGISNLLESGKITLGKTPKTKKITLDSKKDRHILLRDADEDILRIKRENKEAVDRWNKKFGKKDRSNPFEYIKPKKADPDWDPDPSGMASGGEVRDWDKFKTRQAPPPIKGDFVEKEPSDFDPDLEDLRDLLKREKDKGKLKKLLYDYDKDDLNWWEYPYNDDPLEVENIALHLQEVF